MEKPDTTNTTAHTTGTSGGALSLEEITKLKEKGKLHRPFRFWYCLKNKTNDYVNAIQPLGGSFDNIPDFWNIYSFLKRPDQLPNNAQLLCFQEGIKPMWEDDANKDGGKFFLRVHKPYANRFWEDLLLGFLGEQCEENDVICGLIVQVRDNEAKIDIWTKNLYDNADTKKNISNWIRASLGLSENVDIEYRPHPKEEGAPMASSQKTPGGGNKRQLNPSIQADLKMGQEPPSDK